VIKQVLRHLLSTAILQPRDRRSVWRVPPAPLASIANRALVHFAQEQTTVVAVRGR
jgi:hypothetical protein